jgi:hypothetical protein
MKKEARELYTRSIDSMFLAIANFNSPHDRGRVEAVLIFLDRAFELLLKSVIVEGGGRIRDRDKQHTISMSDAIRRCIAGIAGGKPILNAEQALTIQNVNLLRDAAQHYLVALSEQQLFIQTQASVSLFKRVIREVFGDNLTNHFPERVMPVTTVMPQNLHAVVGSACEEIREHLKPKARQRLEACAKLRSLAILENSVSGKSSEPTETEIKALVRKMKAGEDWITIFPELAKYEVITEGSGITLSLRITKKDGDPVVLVKEGTPGATVVGVKRVGDLDFYSLMAKDMAKKLGLTLPRFGALSASLKLKASEDFYKEFQHGSQKLPRYSRKALDLCKNELPALDMDAIWKQHKPTGKLGAS